MSGGSVGFGFVGAGWIASTALAPAVHAAAGAHLQAAAARDRGRASSLEPAGRAYDDYAALLGDDTVDVVYVSLANDAHEPWAVAALEAGKHVLCEKPLGLDAAQARRMHAAAVAADRLLVEAWWYRWHPRTLRAVELVRSGALGRVRRVEAEFSFDGDFDAELAGNYRLDPARGGGAVYDVGCYAVDAARWGLQAGVLDVVHAEGELRDGVDVRAAARLRRPDGDLGTGDAGTAGSSTAGSSTAGSSTAGSSTAGSSSQDTGTAGTATADVRCGIRGRDEQLVAVYGDEATLVLGGESFTTRDVPCRLHLHRADAAGSGAGTTSTEEFAPVDPYRLMVEAVAAAVRGEDVWLPTARDSVDVATVTDAFRARVHRRRPADDAGRR